MNVSDVATTDKGTYLTQLRSGTWFLINWHYVLPQDGTRVPKHVGEADLMFVLITSVHLVGE